MDARIGDVLAQLHTRLAQTYGPRLRGLYLYGSFARGEEDAESDIDVLVVLDRLDNYGAELARTSFIMSELSLACDRSISCVFVAESRWQHDETMFLRNVREEAIPA